MGPFDEPNLIPGWFDNRHNARKVATNIYDVNAVEATPIVEPVSLATAKAHLRVDFTDDDTLITALLTSSRQAIEGFTNLSLAPKIITLTMDLMTAMELPYGPVNPTSGIISFVDSTDTAINTELYSVIGAKFLRIQPFNFWFYGCVLTYNAGYDGVTFVVEQGLILAILNEIAFRYENRGDAADSRKSVNPGICEAARILAGPYQRAAWV